MMIRGVRGAITVTDNTEDEILSGTAELLREMIRVNGIDEEMVASVLFTTTPDLTAAFPARAARQLGWTRVALIGSQEMAVPESLSLCIRVLIHWNTDKSLDEIEHVFMREAITLRPDLSKNGKRKTV